MSFQRARATRSAPLAAPGKSSTNRAPWIVKWLRRASWPNRLQVLFLVAVAYPMGLFGFVEFVQGMIAAQWPIVPGTVFLRDETKRWSILPATRLTIRLRDGTLTYAVVSSSEADQFPADVQVHYSGDPTREVRVVGQESYWLGLLAAALLWSLPLLVLWIAGTWPEFAHGSGL